MTRIMIRLGEKMVIADCTYLEVGRNSEDNIYIKVDTRIILEEENEEAKNEEAENNDTTGTLHL